MTGLASNTVSAAAGAIILYSTWGRQKLRAFLLADLIDVLNLPIRIRVCIEFLVFIAFGTFIAVHVVQPSTPGQAFSAGMGWTGLAARPEGAARRPR